MIEKLFEFFSGMQWHVRNIVLVKILFKTFFIALFFEKITFFLSNMHFNLLFYKMNMKITNHSEILNKIAFMNGIFLRAIIRAHKKQPY